MMKSQFEWRFENARRHTSFVGEPHDWCNTIFFAPEFGSDATMGEAGPLVASDLIGKHNLTHTRQIYCRNPIRLGLPKNASQYGQSKTPAAQSRHD